MVVGDVNIDHGDLAEALRQCAQLIVLERKCLECRELVEALREARQLIATELQVHQTHELAEALRQGFELVVDKARNSEVSSWLELSDKAVRPVIRN